MLTAVSLPIEPLDASQCEPYGWMLGKPVRADGDAPSFVSPASDFWREHLFDTGAPGQTEILWVTYRNRDGNIASLEKHRLTQQAIVCYNRKAGHGQMLRVVGCRELDGPNFLTVSCR